MNHQAEHFLPWIENNSLSNDGRRNGTGAEQTKVSTIS
jgi:hypothetical protein